MNCKEKTKGIKFGKNNLGGKVEKKGKNKIGETGKNVIKLIFPGYKIRKILSPTATPNAFIFAEKNK